MPRHPGAPIDPPLPWCGTRSHATPDAAAGSGCRPGARWLSPSPPLRVVMPVAQAPAEHWSLDRSSDSLADGRRFRALTLVDIMTRESLSIGVDGSLSGQRVVAVLKRLGGAHGLPKILFVDNGPEFTSKARDAWAHQQGVKLAFSRPGTPTDNPRIKAFNARFRAECFNQHWFAALEEARTPYGGLTGGLEYGAAPHRTLLPDTGRLQSRLASEPGNSNGKRLTFRMDQKMGAAQLPRCLTLYMVRNWGSRSIDIAKLVFHVVGMDDSGQVVLRKRIARSELLTFIANVPPLRIGMEACGVPITGPGVFASMATACG